MGKGRREKGGRGKGEQGERVREGKGGMEGQGGVEKKGMTACIKGEWLTSFFRVRVQEGLV